MSTKIETKMAPTSPQTANDFLIDQDFESYTPAEHRMWDQLYKQQTEMLPGYAAEAFLKGLEALDLGRGGIPHFQRMSDELEKINRGVCSFYEKYSSIQK